MHGVLGVVQCSTNIVSISDKHALVSGQGSGRSQGSMLNICG